MSVRVFNGYIKDAFPARHQTHDQMQAWIAQLREAAPDMLTLELDNVENTWVYNDVVLPIERKTRELVFSADHPNEPVDRYASPRDALRSQCLLHERFRWLVDAAIKYPDTAQWVWLEPTIFKQRGITREHVEQFLRNVEALPVDGISLPGVWPKCAIQDSINHWRFAGSCWVCPRKYAMDLWRAVTSVVAVRTRLTHRLCWDNSTWSYIELLNVLPIRWYPGNHDETQLTGYLTGVHQWPTLNAS